MKKRKGFILLVAAGGLISIGVSTMAQNGDVKNSGETMTSTGLDVSHLDEKQKYVTLHDGTEPPFKNKYWDNHEPGIYVDAISGEPLFSSTDKFDSGSGWPSFTKPINEKIVAEFQDDKMGMQRTEVRSRTADAHLGHLFNDGPVESGGQRYCINSASLKFISKDDLEKKGYGEYGHLFDK